MDSTNSISGDLDRRRDALIARLHALPNLMRGAVYERERKCGRASCACASGGPKHLTRQLTVTVGKKTHTRYVRVDEMAEAQSLIESYRELWRIVEALTEVNLERWRGSHPGGRPAGKGRRRS